MDKARKCVGDENWSVFLIIVEVGSLYGSYLPKLHEPPHVRQKIQQPSTAVVYLVR